MITLAVGSVHPDSICAPYENASIGEESRRFARVFQCSSTRLARRPHLKMGTRIFANSIQVKRMLLIATLTFIIILLSFSPIDAQRTAVRSYRVSNSMQLRRALMIVRPGDSIMLRDGTYYGPFVARRRGLPNARIKMFGSNRAVIRNPRGVCLYLVHSSHWHLRGFSLYDCRKGIVLSATQSTVIDRVRIHGTSEEGMIIRNSSSANLIRDSRISSTGLRSMVYGQGIVIGSRASSLGYIHDRSNRNRILNNRFGPNLGSEAVAIRGGTCCGSLRGNTIDGMGTHLSPAAASAALITIRGDRYLVESNSVYNSPVDGFKVLAPSSCRAGTIPGVGGGGQLPTDYDDGERLDYPGEDEGSSVIDPVHDDGVEHDPASDDIPNPPISPIRPQRVRPFRNRLRPRPPSGIASTAIRPPAVFNVANRFMPFLSPFIPFYRNNPLNPKGHGSVPYDDSQPANRQYPMSREPTRGQPHVTDEYAAALHNFARGTLTMVTRIDTNVTDIKPRGASPSVNLTIESMAAQYESDRANPDLGSYDQPASTNNDDYDDYLSNMGNPTDTANPVEPADDDSIPHEPLEPSPPFEPVDPVDPAPHPPSIGGGYPPGGGIGGGGSSIVTGCACGNTFRANQCHLTASEGYCIHLMNRQTCRNYLANDNTARSGLLTNRNDYN